MTNHKWFDRDVQSVYIKDVFDLREIILANCDVSFLVNKTDAIALAKEFGLIVFERDSEL